MGNCATGPKVSKSSEDAEAPIPPPEDAALATEKEDTTTRDVDLKALETKVEPLSKGEDVSTQEVVGLAVVTAEVAAVVVEGGDEEVVEKVKEVVVEEESTAEDAAGSKRLSLSNLFNKEKELKKTPEEYKKTSSEPTKKVEPSEETELPIKESESERKEAAEESVSVPESTTEPQLAAGVVVGDSPEMAKEKVVEVADEKKEKKPEEETKA